MATQQERARRAARHSFKAAREYDGEIRGALNTKCTACDGSGVSIWNPKRPCQDCDGRGWIHVPKPKGNR